jgi:hypothetical protein
MRSLPQSGTCRRGPVEVIVTSIGLCCLSVANRSLLPLSGLSQRVKGRTPASPDMDGISRLINALPLFLFEDMRMVLRIRPLASFFMVVKVWNKRVLT